MPATGSILSPNHVSTGPTERTPLLRRSTRRTTRNLSPDSPADTPGLPHIGPFVAEMRPEDVHKYSIDNLYPPTIQSHSSRVAFSLCALLYFRKYLRDTSSQGRDIWVRWRQEQQHTAALQVVDERIEQVWTQFIADDGSPAELSDVLWTTYPIFPDSRKTVRVLDFLATGEAPHGFLSHPLVYLSLSDTWKYGRHDGYDDDGPLISLLRFVDNTGTPHVLHIIDTVVHLAYLGILCSYLVNPPIQARISVTDLRTVLIAVYAASRIFHPWSAALSPPALAFLSFLSSFATNPLPDSLAFTMLLVAFCWSIVMLHLPVHPGPLFFLPPEQVLPLAVLVWRGIARTFIPVIGFFLPGLLVSLFLLSLSLSDNLLRLSTLSAVSASPMDTRIVFFALFSIIFLFLCCALGSSVLIHPFLSTSEQCHPTWDRYSTDVGLEARQAFIRVVMTYGEPCYFPAPLNMLQTLLVRVPKVALHFVGHRAASPRWTLAERVLWRATVAPITFLVSAFWLWNLPGRW